MRAWLRRNRWGLVGLPIAVSLAFAGTAYRLEDFWWLDRPRLAAETAEQGEFVRYSEAYDDAVGSTRRSFEVRLAGVEDTTTFPGFDGEPTPVDDVEGMRAVVVRLDFRAETDQSLEFCRLALVDAEGNRYPFTASIGVLSQGAHPCLPEDTPGPRQPLFDGQVRDVVPGEERPPTWSTAPVFYLPDDAEITQAELWWEPPRYVRLRVDR